MVNLFKFWIKFRIKLLCFIFYLLNCHFPVFLTKVLCVSFTSLHLKVTESPSTLEFAAFASVVMMKHWLTSRSPFSLRLDIPCLYLWGYEGWEASKHMQTSDQDLSGPMQFLSAFLVLFWLEPFIFIFVTCAEISALANSVNTGVKLLLSFSIT